MRSCQTLTEPVSTTSFNYDIKYLASILALVKKVGGARGLCQRKNDALELVTDEILQFIEKHAGLSHKIPITLSLYEIVQGIAVKIKYLGSPVNINLDLEKAKEEENYAVILIAGFTDVLECKNLGMAGREFYFEIHFNEEQLAKERDRQSLQISPPTSLPIIDTSMWCQDDFKMRLIEKDDAIEVTRCIYSAYGYTYARETVYYPNQFYELHKAGQLQCAVLETPDGQIAGTAILDRETGLPGACELLGLATKKEYQRLGVTKLLCHFLIEQEKKNNKDLITIFAETVTNHPYSQKAFERENFIPTGIFFGLVPATVKFTGFEDQDEPQVVPRISAVYYVKQIAPWVEKTVFVSVKDSEIVKNIFAQVGHAVNIQTTQNQPLRAKCTISMTFVDKLEVGLIQISTIGEDLIELSHFNTLRLKSMGAKIIVVYLNMLDESAAWAKEELTKLGFYFTGVLPGDNTFQPMMLQYFSGLVFKSDEIVIANPVGKEILEHVKNNDQSMSFS